MPVPKVSILIVTYNQEKFISQTIMSAVNQTYKNIEIVVTDDCSTDNTPKIVKELAQKYKNITFVSTPRNLGITANSNFGLSVCTGDYIAFLGGDDLFLHSKIEEQVKFMDANPDCSISYHNVDVFESNTNQTIRLFNNPKKSIEGDIRTSIKLGTFNCACSCMVRKECMPKHLFDPSIPMASDWLFWVECLRDGGRILYINKVLSRYRRHSNNVTSTSRAQCTNDHFVSCCVILKRYPQYSYEALFRMKSLIPDLRKVPGFDYSDLLKIGISNFSLRCLVAWAIYKLSGGKIKK